MLSDEGSKVIRSLGLLNEHIADQHGHYGITPSERHQGVPYPGSYVLDEQGVIIEKTFEQSYRIRPQASEFLESSFGVESKRADIRDQVETSELQATAWLKSATYRPYQKLAVHLGFQVQSGLHVYGKPIPNGYYALEVNVEALDSLEVADLKLPEPRPFQVAGLDEQFQIYEGEFQGLLPVVLSENLGDVELKLRVSYQACSETECFAPQEIELTLPLQVLDNVRD